jgi:hypothetical protein
MWPPNTLEIFCGGDLWKKEGMEAGPTSLPTLPPSHPEQKLQAPEIRTSVLSVWGGGGDSLWHLLLKKNPPPPPRKQIREFSVPIIDFTCHQIIGFSGSIFSAKKTLGGCGWGLEFFLFRILRLKEKKFKTEVGGRAGAVWMSAAHFPSVYTPFPISDQKSYGTYDSCSANLDIVGQKWYCIYASCSANLVKIINLLKKQGREGGALASI